MFFFFNDTATTEIYTLSLHDALPIFHGLKHPEQYAIGHAKQNVAANERIADLPTDQTHPSNRSEEHTSELQSQSNLVCRLLLEKKNIRSSRCLLLACSAGSPCRSSSF